MEVVGGSNFYRGALARGRGVREERQASTPRRRSSRREHLRAALEICDLRVRG